MSEEPTQQPIKICEACEAECDFDATTCPKCGAPFDPEHALIKVTPEMREKIKRSTRRVSIFYIVVMLPIGVYSLVSSIDFFKEIYETNNVTIIAVASAILVFATGIFAIVTSAKAIARIVKTFKHD